MTNKNGKGKKKTVVAVIKGTKSQDIIDVLNKIPLEKRKSVKEITLDMANNMQLASRMCFPESKLVTDRFHVVKLVMEALQHQRIKLRWEAIEKENQAIKMAKEQGIKYVPIAFENDDTPKQLLARSRYIIAKKSNEWTENGSHKFSGDYAKSFSILKRKNFTSTTPLWFALKSFILELKDSAFALVCRFIKKFRMVSKWYFRLFAAVLKSFNFNVFVFSIQFMICSFAISLEVCS